MDDITTQTLATNVTLTGSYVASTYTAITGGKDQHTLYVIYAPDTNSTNALNLVIDASLDGTTWYPVGRYTNSSGTLTKEEYTIAETSAGTTSQALPPITFGCHAQQIRVRYKETNTPAAYGEIYVTLFSHKS